MTAKNKDDHQQASRALIPAPPQAIEPKRWLPGSPSQKLALGVTVSAVGSLLIKRLVELAAEDLYRIGRNKIERSIARQEVPEPTAEQPAVEAQHPIPLDVATGLPPGRYRMRARFTRAVYHRPRHGHSDSRLKNND